MHNTTPSGTFVTMQILSRLAPGKESGASICPTPSDRTPSSAVYAMRSAERMTSVFASFLGLAISVTSASAMGCQFVCINSATECNRLARLYNGVLDHCVCAFLAEAKASSTSPVVHAWNVNPGALASAGRTLPSVRSELDVRQTPFTRNLNVPSNVWMSE